MNLWSQRIDLSDLHYAHTSLKQHMNLSGEEEGLQFNDLNANLTNEEDFFLLLC